MTQRARRACSAPTEPTPRSRARSTRSKRSSAIASESRRRPRVCCANARSSATAQCSDRSPTSSRPIADVGVARRALPRSDGARGARARRAGCRGGARVARVGAPGPAAPPAARRCSGEFVRCRRAGASPRRAATARAWVRALLGRCASLDDGSAFIDARGAVWLPGPATGPGPLRRRAELFALRAELTAHNAVRAAAVSAAERGTSGSGDVGAPARCRVGACSGAETESRRAIDACGEISAAA